MGLFLQRCLLPSTHLTLWHCHSACSTIVQSAVGTPLAQLHDNNKSGDTHLLLLFNIILINSFFFITSSTGLIQVKTSLDHKVKWSYSNGLFVAHIHRQGCLNGIYCKFPTKSTIYLHQQLKTQLLLDSLLLLSYKSKIAHIPPKRFFCM